MAHSHAHFDRKVNQYLQDNKATAEKISPTPLAHLKKLHWQKYDGTPD